MSPGTKIIDGISKWIRESVGPEAENRGREQAETETEAEEDEDSEERDSPVCCSAASSTDVTVLDP